MIDSVRRILRRIVPGPLRVRIATMRRALRDVATGDLFCMAGREPWRDPPPDLRAVLAVIQPIRKSPHWQGKLHNLHIAASRFDGIVCEPDRIFSFWRLLGRPSPDEGFLVGRSIRGDRLETDVGGGLCQISGLIYGMGLRVGMEIVERHPHTRDLYSDETRFTQLGLDATVVWGHKDLRLRNALRQPLTFAFVVTNEWIEGRVLAQEPIPIANIVIDRHDEPTDRRRSVHVWRSFAGEDRALVSADNYVCFVE